MVHHWLRVRIGTKLRNPLFDILEVLVELLLLGIRVEHAEVRRGVRTAAGGPLPAAVVAGQVEIEQFFGEVSFPPTPVDEQVFGEETGGNHAYAVVGGFKPLCPPPS